MAGRLFPLLLLVLPAPVSAGPLIGATLSMAVQGFGPIQFAGVGASGSATSPLHAGLAAGSAFAFTTTAPITNLPTVSPPISGLKMVFGENATASFVGSLPSAIGGRGELKVTFNAIGYGGITLVSVPVTLGAPGTFTPPAQYGVGVTAFANSWTAKVATVPLSPTDGTRTLMGTNSLTPSGRGSVTLVSALNVMTSIAGQLPSFVTLRLEYAPEPASISLALSALMLIGWARRVRRK